ncbi:hypothetical protein FRC03_002515 [Tulasnella sp. 419]|nr:hypothetical protein FRC03_002515 [Tulasnella sp. 419]
MPRAGTSSSSSKDRDANSLKRNQACHQCRKRKLKCDAQRPCSTCARSHAFAARSAHPAPIPPLECTYDDFPPTVSGSSASEDSQEKFERLEAKICMLESLLKQATEKLEEHEAAPLQRTPTSQTNSVDAIQPPILHISPPSEDPLIADTYQMTDMQMQTMFYPPPIVQLHGPFPSPMTSHSSFISTPEQSSPNAFSPEINAQAPMESFPNTNLDPNGDLFPELPLLHPAWPPLLPPPALLHHLVDTFFACCPFANRILHRGRTIASMMYPPDSPEFPLPALLHAICAVASFYTSVIEQPHLPGFNELPPDDFFPTPLRTVKPNASFGESHAHLSTLSASKAIQSGQRMLQVMQSTLILSWFHYSSGTAVNVVEISLCTCFIC